MIDMSKKYISEKINDIKSFNKDLNSRDEKLAIVIKKLNDLKSNKVFNKLDNTSKFKVLSKILKDEHSIYLKNTSNNYIVMYLIKCGIFETKLFTHITFFIGSLLSLFILIMYNNGYKTFDLMFLFMPILTYFILNNINFYKKDLK